MKFALWLMVLCNAFIAPAQKGSADSYCTVRVSNKVGNKLLELGKSYTNTFDEPFTVTRFKYYVSNFIFYTANGEEIIIPSSYFLVNEEDSASKNISLQLQAGSYQKISFLIGVDSIKNESGTQTDALDPMNGMFWTWNSGYIMAKLEGTSPLSKSFNNMIEYHIGGFRQYQNTVRRVVLTFDRPLQLKAENNTSVLIEADINKWFNGKHDLKITEHLACTTPGNLASEYADNYAAMFTLKSAK